MSKEKKADWSKDAAFQKWKLEHLEELQHLNDYTKDELIELVLRTMWNAMHAAAELNKSVRFMQFAIPRERKLTELKADMKYAGVVRREKKREEQVAKVRKLGSQGKKEKADAWILPVQNHAKELWSGNGEEKDYDNERMSSTLRVWLKAQEKNAKINISRIPSRRTIEDNLTGIKKLAKRNPRG